MPVTPSRPRWAPWLLLAILVGSLLPLATASAAQPSSSALIREWSGGHVLQIIQERHDRFSYRGRWAATTHRDYLARQARTARKRGDKISLRFTGTAIAWVGAVGPTRGKARIYLDGRHVKTVDTYSPTFRASRVLYMARFQTYATRRLTIVALGTAGRPRVTVDAFVVRGKSRPTQTEPTPTPTPAPTTAPTKDALLVVGGSLNTSEQQIKQRLGQLGFAVTTRDDDALTTSGLSGYDLVVMSKTVTSTTVGSKLKGTGTGVLFWEDNQQQRSMMATIDETGLADTAWHIGTTTVAMNGGAPSGLRAGLSGSVPFVTGGEVTYAPRKSGESVLTPSAIRVAEAASAGSARWALYAIEKGSALADGGTAAGRRYFFGLYDDTYKDLTSSGRALFDAAVKWTATPSTATIAPTPTPSPKPTATPAPTASTGSQPAFLSYPSRSKVVHEGGSSFVLENVSIRGGTVSNPTGIGIVIRDVHGTITLRNIDLVDLEGGIYIYGSSGTLRIENVRSRNIGTGDIGSGQSNHIQIAESSFQGHIRGSQFLGGRTEDMVSTWHAGGLGVGKELVIEDNRFQGMVSDTTTVRAWDSGSGTGLILGDGAGSAKNGHIIVRRNTFLTPGQVGIQLIDGPGLQVYDNVIYGQKRHQNNNPMTSWEGDPRGVVRDNRYHWINADGSTPSPWFSAYGSLTVTGNVRDTTISADSLRISMP
jgi:hypothetical protein